jgi:hypothetical protein
MTPQGRRLRYKEKFERDFRWFLSVRHKFSFDGCRDYLNKKGENVIVHDLNGVDGKEAFYRYDSEGKILPTRHPNLLHALLKTKGSVNLHIKECAQDRASGILPGILFKEMCEEFKAPEWFVEAVENQKEKYWEKYLGKELSDKFVVWSRQLKNGRR